MGQVFKWVKGKTYKCKGKSQFKVTEVKGGSFVGDLLTPVISTRTGEVESVWRLKDQTRHWDGRVFDGTGIENEADVLKDKATPFPEELIVTPTRIEL